MQCDVTRRVICISNKIEYPDKEHSYKNSTKEVIMWFEVIFEMQWKNTGSKFRVKGASTASKTKLTKVIEG